MSFGNRLKELRLKNGLTMEQFGKCINASSSRISDWENEKNDPSSNFVVEISKHFLVTTDWLLKGKEPTSMIEKQESSVFFKNKWESTSHSAAYKSLLDISFNISESSIQLLCTMADKLAKLETFESSDRKPTYTSGESIYNKKGIVIRDGSSKYMPTEGFIKLPLVGRIPAGNPILAYENIEEHIAVPESLIGNSKETHFLLQVKGSSMINIGIMEGDYVVARQQNSAENGQVVIAMTNEMEVTVKTFYKENSHIRLQPENDSMQPILLKEVNILARVIAVYRISSQS